MYQYRIRCVNSYTNAFGDLLKRYLILQLVEEDNPKLNYSLLLKNQRQSEVEEFYKMQHIEFAKPLNAKIQNHLSDIGVYRTS